MNILNEIKSKPLILNLGCGNCKIAKACNIDVDPGVNPDVVHNLTEVPYPFESSSVAIVYLIHIIEHISELNHASVLSEIHRILVPQGRLIIAYPEFIKCAQYYIDNKGAERDFWKATLYGRQLTKSDYHVALMDTRYFSQLLQAVGFTIDSIREEQGHEYNTIIEAIKGNQSNTRETVLKEEIFGENNGKCNSTERAH